jgi:hypothetical protein
MTRPDQRNRDVRSIQPPGEGRLPVVRDRAGAVVANDAPEERRILAFMGETRRVGRWAVPRLLRVRAILGEVRIDLRENPIPEQFTLDVRAWGARVTLIVPPGVSVRSDVFALMANAINQADEVPAEGESQPRVQVSGSAILGEVRVLVRDRTE